MERWGQVGFTGQTSYSAAVSLSYSWIIKQVCGHCQVDYTTGSGLIGQIILKE